jgi:type II secretory pathway pseudopilin PulG
MEIRRLNAFTKSRPAAARMAFTLTELIVAVGLLALMMSLAAGVFSLTVQSSGQATSLIEVSQTLRNLENRLRDDLSGVRASTAIMMIVASEVDAYWTLDGQEADNDTAPMPPKDDNDEIGYPHTGDPEREDAFGRMIRPRIDRLAFFTERPTTSFVSPEVCTQLQYVMYGHTDFGDLDAIGQWQGSAPPAHESFTRNPAQHWHLSRRSVPIVAAPINTTSPEPWEMKAVTKLWETTGGTSILDDDSTLDDDTGLPLDLIRNGQADVLIDNGSTAGSIQFDYVRDVEKGLSNFLIAQAHIGPMASPDPEFFPNRHDLLARTRLDLTPPATQAGRLGPAFLPNCASFKVEWTFQDLNQRALREIIWIDPLRVDRAVARLTQLSTDPSYTPAEHSQITALLNNFEDVPVPVAMISSDPDDDIDGDGIFERFEPTDATTPDPIGTIGDTQDPPIRTQLHEFYATDPSAPSPAEAGPDPFFPTALRITVDLFDAAGRFDRPVRHVMIIPVGS